MHWQPQANADKPRSLLGCDCFHFLHIPPAALLDAKRKGFSNLVPSSLKLIPIPVQNAGFILLLLSDSRPPVCATGIGMASVPPLYGHIRDTSRWEPTVSPTYGPLTKSSTL